MRTLSVLFLLLLFVVVCFTSASSQEKGIKPGETVDRLTVVATDGNCTLYRIEDRLNMRVRVVYWSTCKNAGENSALSVGD